MSNSQRLDVKEMAQALFDGERAALGQAITLIESNIPKHRQQAEELLSLCLPHTGNSLRIGITGAPGVGKSSFIESLGQFLIRKHERRIAVLAIDPSSHSNKGSILGDKTRMDILARHQNAFVRPSPSAGSLNGITFRTREVMLLCEAAGYNTILIETVGVGQSQIDVKSMVDFLLLLVLPGSGDVVQGIKRGIMEIADLIAITKADGANQNAAHNAYLEYKIAIGLQKYRQDWKTQVLTCSAHSNEGNVEIWNIIEEYTKKMQGNGCFSQNRRRQSLSWIREKLQERFTLLLDQWFEKIDKNSEYSKWDRDLMQGKIKANELAQKLWEEYHKKSSDVLAL